MERFVTLWACELLKQIYPVTEPLSTHVLNYQLQSKDRNILVKNVHFQTFVGVYPDVREDL